MVPKEDTHSILTMLTAVVKVAALAATSVVVLPYLTALMCNLAYGWPQVGSRYRRAFSPRKVYALNYSVIQSMLVSLRYATLYMQWKAWYRSATSLDVIKDRLYGCNSQKLDLYLPTGQQAGDESTRPVIVFAYGGAWGSGNKKMYGLLCSALANRLNAIVCCPNHSTYPQGCADDMIQDMVECLSWLYQNVEQYKGDKNRIMMIGHSSGAHLCAMTMLELFHDPIRRVSATDLPPMSPSILHFRERHFADRQLSNMSAASGNTDTMQSLAESFQIINGDNGNSKRVSLDNNELTSSHFEVLETQKSVTELSEGSLLESEIQELTRLESGGPRYRGNGLSLVATSNTEEQSGLASAPNEEGTSGRKWGEIIHEEIGDSGAVIPQKQIEREVIPTLTDQPTMLELRKSLRAIIGLAGVYHIGDHFQYESMRGIEDLSAMCRAMRGPENFDRFSPTHIVSKISTPMEFPKVVLLHGTGDYVVPISSSVRFADELKRIETDVLLRIIPGCDHYEICLDLMKPSMTFHNTVMEIIEDTANSVFF